MSAERAPRITNTGNLRRSLAKAFEDLESGSKKVETVRELGRIAGRINDSLYSETKIAAMRREVGEQPAALGNLRLGPPSPDAA